MVSLSDIGDPAIASSYLDADNSGPWTKECLSWLGGHRKKHPLPPCSRPALLIIDVQDYFFHPASPAFLPVSPFLTKPMNRLISVFRSARQPLIFTRHVDNEHSPLTEWWKHALLADNPFSRLCFEPETSPVIVKSGYDAFQGTSLGDLLTQWSIDQLICCGVMTHLCIDTTVRSAFQRGLHCVIPVNAVGSKNELLHVASLAALAHGFAVMSDVKEIEAWIAS